MPCPCGRKRKTGIGLEPDVGVANSSNGLRKEVVSGKTWSQGRHGLREDIVSGKTWSQ
ncbi:hypothetical protein ANAPC5_01275 [Anaplasma phagocytophilum]|nr:hypothetical protein ANAPC5_01275 [Anaplasma phagocytophilum]